MDFLTTFPNLAFARYVGPQHPESQLVVGLEKLKAMPGVSGGHWLFFASRRREKSAQNVTRGKGHTRIVTMDAAASHQARGCQARQTRKASLVVWVPLNSA